MFSAIASAIFIEAMPFLVIGALFSAIIEVFVSTDRLLRFIPKRLAGGLLLGVGAGFLIPTCECGVVPIVRRLMHKGVPPFIAITYMLAAPIVNPVVLASTYIAFQGSLTMVAARVLVAAVVAAIIGVYVSRLKTPILRSSPSCSHDDTRYVHFLTPHPSCGCGVDHDHDHSKEPLIQKIRSVVVHGAGEFMDMGKFLIIGAMAAAAFKTMMPENIMTYLSGNLEASIIGMMILAILLSICSEADAFVAASFQTLSGAAKLSFIVIGPMVDLKLIGMFSVTFKRRLVLVLILAPVILVFILSWVLGRLGWLT